MPAKRRNDDRHTVIAEIETLVPKVIEAYRTIDQLNDLLVRGYLAGVTIEKLSEITGISDTDIFALLTKRSETHIELARAIEAMRKQVIIDLEALRPADEVREEIRQHTQRRNDLIVRLYLSGYAERRIAEATNLSVDYVRSMLTSRGVRARLRHHRSRRDEFSAEALAILDEIESTRESITTKERNELIGQAYTEGATMAAIAEVAAVSLQRIDQIVGQLGLKKAK